MPLGTKISSCTFTFPETMRAAMHKWYSYLSNLSTAASLYSFLSFQKLSSVCCTSPKRAQFRIWIIDEKRRNRRWRRKSQFSSVMSLRQIVRSSGISICRFSGANLQSANVSNDTKQHSFFENYRSFKQFGGYHRIRQPFIGSACGTKIRQNDSLCSCA